MVEIVARRAVKAERHEFGTAFGIRLQRNRETPTHMRGVEQRVFDLLKRDLPLRDDTTNELAPRFLPLSLGARQLLIEGGNEVERELRAGGAWADVRPAANKIIEQACRIAGVMTLFADADASDVGEDVFADALQLAL